MDLLVIALSINPRPLSALELKLSGLIMESQVDTAGDNQNVHVIISNYLNIPLTVFIVCILEFNKSYNKSNAEWNQ